MELYDIIKRPLITEESTRLAAELNQFTFEVDVRANKIEIRRAVEVLFEVDVLEIYTTILPMKRGTRGRKQYVRKPAMKKAIVKLPDGQKINEFNV
jgi:large subunit ribosomal protein L23